MKTLRNVRAVQTWMWLRLIYSNFSRPHCSLSMLSITKDNFGHTTSVSIAVVLALELCTSGMKAKHQGVRKRLDRVYLCTSKNIALQQHISRAIVIAVAVRIGTLTCFASSSTLCVVLTTATLLWITNSWFVDTHTCLTIATLEV